MLLGAQLRRLREARRGQPGGRRLGDPGLRVEDQPDGAGPGRLQGARRRRPAHPLRRHRADERAALLTLAREANSPGLVAPLRRRAAAAGSSPTSGWRPPPSLIRTLRGAVRARPAADPGVRPRGRPARPRPSRAGARSTAGSACGWSASGCCAGRTRRSCGRWSTRRRCAGRSVAREVMRGQLAALIEATRLPQRPAAGRSRSHAGGHAAAGGAFTILRFGDQDLPDIVYIEQLTSALYLDKRDDLDHYAAAMERSVCRGAAAGADRRRSSRASCATWRRRRTDRHAEAGPTGRARPGGRPLRLRDIRQADPGPYARRPVPGDSRPGADHRHPRGRPPQRVQTDPRRGRTDAGQPAPPRRPPRSM